MEKIRVNISITRELHKKYKDLAKKTGLSMSKIMEIALKNAIDEDKPKQWRMF